MRNAATARALDRYCLYLILDREYMKVSFYTILNPTVSVERRLESLCNSRRFVQKEIENNIVVLVLLPLERHLKGTLNLLSTKIQ